MVLVSIISKNNNKCTTTSADDTSRWVLQGINSAQVRSDTQRFRFRKQSPSQPCTVHVQMCTGNCCVPNSLLSLKSPP